MTDKLTALAEIKKRVLDAALSARASYRGTGHYKPASEILRGVGVLVSPGDKRVLQLISTMARTIRSDAPEADINVARSEFDSRWDICVSADVLVVRMPDMPPEIEMYVKASALA